MYSATTGSIHVSVEPIYIEDYSSTEDNRYVWAYHIMIENKKNEAVQLRRRYWRITDATGHVQEVEGAGVVGQQPLLQPGQSFSYTSGVPLNTPSGFMEGFYVMETDDGKEFKVNIPRFSLDSPHMSGNIH